MELSNGEARSNNLGKERTPVSMPKPRLLVHNFIEYTSTRQRLSVRIREDREVHGNLEIVSITDKDCRWKRATQYKRGGCRSC